MSEYDFEGEARIAAGEDPYPPPADNKYPGTEAALRRAYAAGKADAYATASETMPHTSTDLDRLVILASTHRWWGAPVVPSPSWQDEVAAECASMLSALKAQAVAK